ncbi:MAG: ABC transporter permease [Defluviitaleaceae bacterium]|nr:ABC transporter permease [Defluviitaleaceae bacterium]
MPDLLNLQQFALIYVLLVVILVIMKKCNINQSKLVIVASVRMTVQLVLAGVVLTYIFAYPHPLLTTVYLIAITGFGIQMILARNRALNRKFKLIIGVSTVTTGLIILAFYIIIVLDDHFFNPQLTIPLSGMIMGNAVSGVALGLKTFEENLQAKRHQIDVLINMGVTPQKALLPLINQAIETAILPTIITMTSMGIIKLPGMMTGQMIAGAMPMTAILYQISVIIAIAAVTCLSVFCTLYFGYRTLWNERNQLLI